MLTESLFQILAGTSYAGSVQFLNEMEDPAEDPTNLAKEQGFDQESN